MTKDENKTEYLTALFLEAVRYAEINRDDLDDDEYGLMIRSVWKLMDPVKNGKRKKSVSTLIKNDDGTYTRFSAHSHDNEPMCESYDDILVYHSMIERDNSAIHYIVDRFCPKKII